MDVVRTDISNDVEKYYEKDGYRPVGNYVICNVAELSRDGATSSSGSSSSGGSSRIEAEQPTTVRIGPDIIQNVGFVELKTSEKGEKSTGKDDVEKTTEEATKEDK
jgi:hypothetical protein